MISGGIREGTPVSSNTEFHTVSVRKNGRMSTSVKRRLVLVTGAGASRHFGHGDRPLPLMADWSDALVKALNRSEPNLADTIGLRSGLSGEEFEEALGAFLRWTQTFDATQRFLQVGRAAGGGLVNEVPSWLHRARERSRIIIEAINSSLWSEFGLDKVDESKAVDTYRRLFQALDALPSGSTQLFSATTNYDRSGEVVFSEIGFTAKTGARGRTGRTQHLDVEAIEVWDDPSPVPHIHLHGAVGWYRDQDGRIRIQPADEEYDNRRTPAVLHPDPNKDPVGDVEVGVHTLWQKLSEALDKATHVLLLGHSLHDRPLLDALAQASRDARFAVCFHEDRDGIQATLNSHDVFQRSDINVSYIAMDFRPEHDFAQVSEWVNGSHIRKDGTSWR